MSRGIRLTIVWLLCIALLPTTGHAAAGAPRAARFGELPMRFEASSSFLGPAYVARGIAYGASLSATGAWLRVAGTLGQARVRLGFVGADPQADLRPLGRLAATSNHLIGADPARWRVSVPQFAKVRAERVYPGIDVEYYGSDGNLEYDFLVAPGADPSRIRVAFDGVHGVRVGDSGELLLSIAGGEIIQHPPLAYQRRGGGRTKVDSRYRINADKTVGIELGTYDRGRRLVIDPVLGYSTYLGGNGGANADGIAVDDKGNVYITGYTQSTDFDAFGPIPGIAPDLGCGGPCGEAFVAKFSPTGAPVYSTYLGGESGDSGTAIAVDAAGSAYVSGRTFSPDFPTVNPIPGQDGSAIGNGAVFVAKLNPAGNGLVYSTYFGGTGGDDGAGIAVDASGSAYVTGGTQSRSFPVVGGIPGETFDGGCCGDAFVSKLSPAGNAFVYSTFLGGRFGDRAEDIAVDPAGAAVVVGITDSDDFGTAAGPNNTLEGDQGLQDAFLAKLAPGGASVAYATYLGGSRDDVAKAVALDAAGNAYVTGGTLSPDFDVVGGLPGEKADGCCFDIFVSKLNATGTALAYSTYLGGGAEDLANSIAVDGGGSAYVGGYSQGAGFRLVDPVQPGYGGGTTDAVIAKLTPGGNDLVFSTFIGGSAIESAAVIALHGQSVLLAGGTDSADFPTVNRYEGDSVAADAVLAKLIPPGRSRPAAVRGSTTWLLRSTLSTGPETVPSFTYGTKPLVPLMGDWDGDGTVTPGAFERGVFRLRNSNTAGAANQTFAFGDARGFAVAGDFDGDGTDDVGVYRNGTWQTRLSTGATSSFVFGSGAWPSTVPVTGDWNGDGIDGIGTYTYGSAVWSLRNSPSASGADIGPLVFGTPNSSYPVVGDWDADGDETLGAKTGTTWSLRNANSPGPVNLSFDYGLANDLPLSWK